MCEREPENASDRYTAKKDGRTFASKAVAGVFAVFATGRYYRMYSNWVQEIQVQLTWHKADLKFPALYFSRQHQKQWLAMVRGGLRNP